MNVPPGAYPYVDWPGYVNIDLVKRDVYFYRNPSWLVIVPEHPDGAGVIWNTATGFALRDETMTVLKSRTQAKKEITAVWLKTVLPYRPGNNPYKYWPRYYGQI